MAKTLDANWRESEYLTAAEISLILKVSKVYAYAIMRQLPCFKLGKSLRVPTKAFLDYLKKSERSSAS